MYLFQNILVEHLGENKHEKSECDARKVDNKQTEHAVQSEILL